MAPSVRGLDGGNGAPSCRVAVPRVLAHVALAKRARGGVPLAIQVVNLCDFRYVKAKGWRKLELEMALSLASPVPWLCP